MWAVVETYYKYAEYALHIFKTEKELKAYILEELIEYEYKIYWKGDTGTTWESWIESQDIESLIEIVVEMGNDRVQDQHGWGVREIQKIL